MTGLMNSYQTAPSFGCYCVPHNNQDRLEAAKHLIRPDRVGFLFQQRRSLSLHTPAEEISFWLWLQLKRGTLAYQPDPPNCDRWCEPYATWHRGGGDCDDLAILICSMLRYQGIETSFVVGDYQGKDTLG